MHSALRGFMRDHGRWFVLTGAGVSTASGIPGYRDELGRWKRSPPVQLQDFLQSAATRRRYWARSLVGWLMIARARPNAAHEALARLQAAGRIEQLVTQNVDGLHQQAGSREVTELHGNLARVICLDCRREYPRSRIQEILERDNPEFVGVAARAAPDGDADIEPAQLESFAVPPCPNCGGLLKPDVVFFGEGVPRARVDAAMAGLDRADAMIVFGSSLMVYSGYRFCERASSLGKPIVLVNQGVTRADPIATLKLDESCIAALDILLKLVAESSGDERARAGDFVIQRAPNASG